MIDRFRRWLAPPVFPDSEIKTRRAALINYMLLTFLVLVAFIFIGALLGGRTPTPVLVITVLALIVNLALRAWLRRGRLARASIGLMVLNLSVITADVALLGTVRAPLTSVLVLVVIMAGLLFDLSGMIIMIVLCSLTVAGLIGAENTGWLFPPDLSVTVTQWVTYTAMFVWAGSLTYAAQRSINRALLRAENELLERQRAETALRQTHAELERRVEERTAQLTTTSAQLQQELTERKQAESQREAALEALRANRRQLTDIIDFLPDATLAIDREKRIIIWNKAIEKMTGVPAAAMIGRGDYAYTVPFYGEARPQLMDLVFEDQGEIAARYPTITREGDTLLAEVFCNALYDHKGAWVTAKASPLHDQFGNVIGAIESIHDITVRKQAEEALHTTVRRFQIILSSLYGGILVVSDDSRIEFANQAFCDLFDLNDLPEDLFGLSVPEMLQKITSVYANPPDALARIQKIVDKGQPIKGEEIAARGERTYIRDFIPIVIDGKRYGRLWHHQDITARKQAEEALRESKQQLNHITDNIPVIVTYVNAPDFRFKFVNRTYANMFGMQPQELISKQVKDILPGSAYERSLPYYERVRAGERVHYENKTVVPISGESRWLSIDYIPELDEQGIVQNILALGYDITDRKLAEEALRESEAKYRRIVETANEGIVSLDSQARITFANRQMAAMLGYTVEEMLGQKIESFLAEDQLSDHAAQMKNRALGKSAVYERCFRRKDDSPHWALISASAILDANGEFAGSFGMLADITERKRAESQREAALAALRQSHAELQTRNEELDAFAHTVAHDLKNPLGVMASYAELLLDTYGDLPDENVRQALVTVSRSGRKAGNIIESLLMLASVRKQDVQAVPLDMAHIVDEAVLRLADLIQDSGADLHMPDRASWPVALGHAPWIEEIWVNYLGNAIKYGGPRPRIELGAARLPPLSATGEGQGGGFIRFSVRDYGPGLTSEQQARLFAPFERLGQARVEGHGLGLSVVRCITEKLGGQAGVVSQPGTLRGSTFYLTLPAAPAPKP
jgi:PAS domain S-box-containing protein